jgi:hypothetical protein
MTNSSKPTARLRAFSRFLPLLPLVFFLVLTGLYLSPGTEALLEGRTDTVLSDDTDPSPLPYTYETLRRIFDHRPADFFFGAVVSDRGSPSGASALWIPWSEKWTVLAASFFIPYEQISTFFVYILLVANALAMYALCRYQAWSRNIALALAMAWAFNPYTLARAKVHMALAGTFHLPLIFLGLLLIVKGRDGRSLVFAALCFLAATTTAHYLIITAAFVSPFYFLYLGIQRDRLPWARLIGRTLLATLPAVLFLLFCLKFPVPPHAQLSLEKTRPQSLLDVPEGTLHPFLTRFAVRPSDYLTGNVAFGELDLNPLRGQLNSWTLSHLGESFAHERAAGIRWLFLTIVGCLPYLFYRRSLTAAEGPILFFTGFAAFGFWLSLAPGALGIPGPSEWLYGLIKNIRVPSRANILVQFSFLMMAGLVLNEIKLRRFARWLLIPGLLPALVIIELPPLLQAMPMAPIRPRYESLARENGSCGIGLHFPVTNFDFFEVHHYHFIQRMRGSDCIILNNDQTRAPELALLNRFPLVPDFLKALNDPLDGPKIAASLESLVRCIPLNWIAFDPATSPAWRESFCQRLNWKLNSELVCIGPSLDAPLTNQPSECLK